MNKSDSVWYIPNLSKLIDLHNEARIKNAWMWNIDTLKTDNNLMNYANDWAETMALKNRLQHSKMGNIMKLGFSIVSENIAYGQKTEDDVMKTWLRSPGHRKNILSTSVNSIGCGFRYSDSNIIYWCVCFGNKKD